MIANNMSKTIDPTTINAMPQAGISVEEVDPPNVLLESAAAAAKQDHDPPFPQVHFVPSGAVNDPTGYSRP